MTTEASLVGLVFLPLLAACLLWAVGQRAPWLRQGLVWLSLLAPLALLLAPTLALTTQPVVEVVLAGHAPPLGIGLRLDALSLLMLWLVAVVGAGAGAYASFAEPPGSDAGTRFWPPWLLLMAGLNALFLSADLFNLYVAIELVTLAAVALVAWSGKGAALRAAMRYLLLAMLASLAYLLAVALLYAEHGTLDLYLLARGVAAGSDTTRIALALLIVSLLLKAAIFPLHIWLPPAHARAPGAVSAVLSALVVKGSVYLVYRIWFWTLEGAQPALVANLLGALGAGAILYGSIAALLQSRLKPLVAYSTVAQLGYLMLVFPMTATVASGALAWKGAIYQLLSHGLAKAALFLAAASLLRGIGSDRLVDLAGASRRFPLSVFAVGLSGISLMGLPPSGGFLAKWLLLEAAWIQRGWVWMAVLLLGSLLASVYMFRALSAMMATPGDDAKALVGAALARPVPWQMDVAAVTLALLAVIAGFASAPIFELLNAAAPFPRVESATPITERALP